MFWLCEHYRKRFPGAVGMTPAEYTFNAWIEYPSGFRSHATGVFGQYMRHLKEHPECRKEIGISLETIESFLEDIKKEWQSIMRS